jgi:hypothetical protein
LHEPRDEDRRQSQKRANEHRLRARADPSS